MSINLDLVGKKSKPVQHSYTWKDCILYALGIGAGPAEIEFLYEGGDLKVFPTFAVIPSFTAMVSVVGDLGANPLMILHGEQKIVCHRPIPPEGTLTTVSEVQGIYDKGKGALVVAIARTASETGEPLFDNIFSIFCRGEGGFGGERGPEALKAEPPDGRAPDFHVEHPTQPSQALLYRLSGDLNPLHASAEIAMMAGFEKPILHGLCTYGHVGRAILHSVAGSDPARFQSFAARFSSAVYPGDTIITEGWREAPGRYLIRATTQRGNAVITNSVAEVVE